MKTMSGEPLTSRWRHCSNRF